MKVGDLVKSRENGEIGIVLDIPHKHSTAFYQVHWTQDGHTEYTHNSKLEKVNESR